MTRLPSDGDFDRNIQMDFVDLAAMAARLGTSPASASQPYYDWNEDMTGAVTTIDDADLTAFLAKFGGRP